MRVSNLVAATIRQVARANRNHTLKQIEDSFRAARGEIYYMASVSSTDTKEVFRALGKFREECLRSARNTPLGDHIHGGY